jgi:NhaP-type Na+/H+ or K+/H+ antiporter
MDSNVILAIGLILIGGFFLGMLAEKIGLPKVTGYRATGLLLNPKLISVIPHDLPESTGPLVNLCLAFITFEVGTSLSIEKIKRFGKSLLLVSGLEAFGAFLLVFMGFLAMSPLMFGDGTVNPFISLALPFSLLLAALAAPTDPSATMAVMHQYKAKGKVADTILGCAAFDDAFTLIIYSICLTLASSLVGDDTSSTGVVLGSALISIVGALAVGIFFGLTFNYFTRVLKVGREGQLIVVLLATVSLSFGVSSLFGFDELLSTMALGSVVANFNVGKDAVKTVVERYTEELIFIFFFVLSAMHLSFNSFGTYWHYIIVFIVLRAGGKYLGTFIGLALTGAEPKVKKFTFTGLIPQGGIVMGLALVMQKNADFNAFSSILVGTIMSATLIHEFIGPMIAKWGLMKAGEIKKPN